jgi:hypothetical protein
VTPPATAAFGYTYARFRLSTVDGTGPTGDGGIGEVEDYRVFVGDAAVWHNAALGEDVNATGRVTSADLIILGGFLGTYGPQIYNPDPALSDVPVPPGDPNLDPPFPVAGPPMFYDVNGDNSVNLQDLRDIYYYLNPPAPLSLESPDDRARVSVAAPESEAPQSEAPLSDPPTLVIASPSRSGPALRTSWQPADPADTTLVGTDPAEPVLVDPSTVVAVGALVDSPANTYFSGLVEDIASDSGTFDGSTTDSTADQTGVGAIVDEVFAGQEQAANTAAQSPDAYRKVVELLLHPEIVAMPSDEIDEQLEFHLEELIRDAQGSAAEQLSDDLLGDLIVDVLDE